MKNRSLILFALAAACGDNGAALDASPIPVDSAGGGDGGADGSLGPSTAIIAAGDFKAGDPGILSKVVTQTHSTTENITPGSVGDDPVVRIYGGQIFIVNRADGNNVTILDAASLQLVTQIATGSGTNPQDVAVIGTTLYVPVLGGTGVELLDSGGSGSATTISFGSDDPDGHPDCNSAIAVGTNVFVSCELLDAKFAPRGVGKIHVIDSTTNTVSASFDMQTKNPFGLFELLPDALTIAIPTIDFSNGSGCVEQITTTGTPASGGCLVNNTDLDGYATRLAFQGNTLLMAVSASDFIHASLVPFDLGASTLGSDLSPDTEVIGDVATCPDGTIAVTDTGSDAGMRFYSKTAELTTAAIDIGLAPKSAHGLVCQ